LQKDHAREIPVPPTRDVAAHALYAPQENPSQWKRYPRGTARLVIPTARRSKPIASEADGIFAHANAPLDWSDRRSPDPALVPESWLSPPPALLPSLVEIRIDFSYVVLRKQRDGKKNPPTILHRMGTAILHRQVRCRRRAGEGRLRRVVAHHPSQRVELPCRCRCATKGPFERGAAV
jgi:hypothetical protein